jgi:hypothetical protein
MDNNNDHKPTRFYRIEYWQREPLNRWAQFGTFQYMRKSFAEGAFAMLKSMNGGDKRYRLLDGADNIIDEHRTGTIHVN